MHKFINGEGGKYTRDGQLYYEEFKDEFYDKPSKYYYFFLNVCNI